MVPVDMLHVVLSVCVSVITWFTVRLIGSMDKVLEAHAAKLSQHDEKLADHGQRLAVLHDRTAKAR